jgi:hypothetical protein
LTSYIYIKNNIGNFLAKFEPNKLYRDHRCMLHCYQMDKESTKVCLHFDYPNLLACFYILPSFMCIIWHYLSTDSCSMLSLFSFFCAAIAELLDNVIDEVIVKVPKYSKIKIEDKYGYFASASFEVNNQATFVRVNKFTSLWDGTPLCWFKVYS